jgi:ketosteroid isomerase-like protein
MQAEFVRNFVEKPPSTTTPGAIEALVRGSFSAFATKDRVAMEALLADDFHFTSPLDNRIDRKTYFEVCWPGSERMDGFDIERLTVDGDHAFVTYEGRMGKETFRNTEVHTVRGDKIAEVEVYFGWNMPHRAKPGTHKDTGLAGLLGG